MACPKDSKPVCPKSILYATEKIIKTPILENNVKANDEEVINEQAQYYQLLLNFWKELENERELK